MIRTKRLTWLSLALLLLATGLLPALTRTVSAQDATPTTTAGTFPTTARFVNAMTSVDTIDIDLNDEDNRVVEGLKYGQVSDPVELTAPAANIIVKQPRDLQYDLWLYNTIVPTTAGQSYVITISDFLVIPVSVDTSSLPGKLSRARVVHAAPQAPAVDLLKNGERPAIVKGIAYGQVTEAGTLAEGTYDFTLNATESDTVVLDVANYAVAASQAYTLVLIGKPGSTEQPLQLVTVSDPLSA